MGLGMEDKLVAVNYLADDPVSSNIVEQAKKIQHKIKKPLAEEVLALKPDVVFGVQEIAHAAYGEAFAMQGVQHLRVK